MWNRANQVVGVHVKIRHTIEPADGIQIAQLGWFMLCILYGRFRTLPL
jgi:hypothetical protein